MNRTLPFLAAILAFCASLQAAPPKDATALAAAGRPASWSEKDAVITAGSGDWVARGDLANVRVHLEYLRPAAAAKASVTVENGVRRLASVNCAGIVSRRACSSRWV